MYDKDHKKFFTKMKPLQCSYPMIKKLQYFKSTKITWYVPLVIHFDTEAVLVPSHTSASAPNASGNMKLEKHISSGYAFIIAEHGNDKVLPFKMERENNCLDNFIKELKKANEI